MGLVASDLRIWGDLKSTFASTQKQFDEAIDFFDWDRSRAWYMDIAGSRQDFIYGISKKNQKVFKAFIKRGDTIYQKGKEKYEELALVVDAVRLKINRISFFGRYILKTNRHEFKHHTHR